MKHIVLAFSLSVTFIFLKGQPGTPDISFGTNGIVRTDFGGDFTLSPNDSRKIILLDNGSFYLMVSSGSFAYVTRRLPDGSPDITYGTNGFSSLVEMYSRTAALQTDGKIIVAGSGFIFGGSDFMLARFNTNGLLDSCFSGDGLVRTSLTSKVGQEGYDIINSIVLQSDGRIVAAGSSDQHFALTRYLPDGGIDNSFSNDGIVRTIFPGQESFAKGVAIQTDGRIIAAGNAVANNLSVMAIARYLPDGTPDNSFSFDGLQTVLSGVQSDASSVELQPDGRILLGGGFKTANFFQFGIVRLHPGGDPDNSFSGDGFQSAVFGSAIGSITDISLQQDGKIVAGGIVFVPGGGATDFALARFNSDGLPDNSFSEDGKVITPVSSSSEELHSIAVSADGKILAAGSALTPFSHFAVVKYNSNGTLDNSFDGDGILTGFKTTPGTSLKASVVQADGKIVVVGSAYVKIPWSDVYQSEIAVARYNTDGTLDLTFSDDGKLTVDYGWGSGFGEAVALQQDGKVVIGGTVNSGSNDDFAIIRLNSDGTMDNSFSGDGKLLYDIGNSMDVCYSVAVQPDGRILAGGFTVDYTTTRYSDIAVLRLNPDGTPDNSFSNDGVAVQDFLNERGESTTNAGRKMLLQPDGRIVMMGQYAWFTAHVDFMVCRFLPDGTLDASFNGTGLVTTPLGNSVDQPLAAALQMDGKIVVCGIGSALTGHFAAVRYNTDGTLDNSFSGDGKMSEDVLFDPLSVAIQPDGKLLFGGGVYIYRYNSDGTPDYTFGENGKLAQETGPYDRFYSLNVAGNRLYGVGTGIYNGTTGFVAAYNLGCTLDISMQTAMALPSGVDANTVYLGYAPASALTLALQAGQASAQSTYLWSNGATTSSITVSPLVPTTYSVTVTDAQGCSGTASVLINVKDIRCGPNKVVMCHIPKGNPRQAKTSCINASAVAANLANGSYLGNCREDLMTRMPTLMGGSDSNIPAQPIQIFPNPASSQFSLSAGTGQLGKMTVNIYDVAGRLIETKQPGANGKLTFGASYSSGVYYAEIVIGEVRSRARLIKQ